MAADNGEKELMIRTYCRQVDRAEEGGGGDVREEGRAHEAKGDWSEDMD